MWCIATVVSVYSVHLECKVPPSAAIRQGDLGKYTSSCEQYINCGKLMNIYTILKLWTLIKNIIETLHKFPYNILFTFLMDRGRAPNGIGHLIILLHFVGENGNFFCEYIANFSRFWVGPLLISAETWPVGGWPGGLLQETASNHMHGLSVASSLTSITNTMTVIGWIHKKKTFHWNLQSIKRSNVYSSEWPDDLNSSNSRPTSSTQISKCQVRSDWSSIIQPGLFYTLCPGNGLTPEEIKGYH